MVKITLFQMQNSCQVKKSPFLRKKINIFAKPVFNIRNIFLLNGKIFRIKQATHHSSFFQRYLTPQKNPLFVQKTTPYSLFQTRAQH